MSNKLPASSPVSVTHSGQAWAIDGGNGADDIDATALWNANGANGGTSWSISGGNGADTIHGSAHAELIWGDSGSDSDTSGNGADTIYGGGGNDEIHGGNGADFIEGDDGGDTLYGGRGPDTFDYNFVNDSNATSSHLWAGTAACANSTGDWIKDFNKSEGDTLDLSGLNSQLTGTGHPAGLQWAGTTPTAYGVWTGAYGNGTSDTIIYADTNGDGLADVAIRVTGSIDGSCIVGPVHPPVVHNDTNSVLEDHIVSGNVSTNDSDPYGYALSYSVSGSAPAGLTLHTDGTYTFDAGNAAYQHLAAGATQDVLTTLNVSDGHGGFATETLTIHITGVNDAATFSGADTGAVTEDAVPNTATGHLIVSDVDNAGHVVAQSGVGGSYGSFSIDASGNWSYALNNGNAAVNALNVGQHLTDTFTITTDDGTTHQISVTINGANDAATFGGADTGSVTEDAVPNTATGQLIVSDVDNAGNVVAQSGVGGSYGSFSIDASGNWSYALNNGNAAVNALNVGQHLTDTFTITTDDGTTHQISVTINGANDAATFSGADTGAVTEDAVPNTATGHLIVSDVDNAGNVLTQTDTAGDHGSFSIDAAGNWSYALNNGNAAVNALNVGQHLTDTFTITTDDGTTHQISVTINGANDAATFGGADTGSVTEDAVPNTATGQLIVSDVDNAGHVVAQSGVGGSYGSFSIDASGNWSYALNNGNAAVNALNVGQHLTDTFTVTTDDGTTHQISVTINGANDAATFGGADTGSVTEDAVPNTATGQLIVSDVDNAGHVVAQSGVGGSYGSFSIDASGNWSYALNNGNAAVNALNVGQHLTDTFTITTDDGTTHQISVTINGANDAATFGGADTGSVTEDAVPNTATGQLIVSDVDNAGHVVAQSGVGGSYGSFSIDASGNWSYALNNGNAAVNALNVGQHLTDTFTVTTDDGTTHQISVTINGANDAATFGGADTGSVTEDAVPNTATGQLIVSDVDNAGHVVAQSGVGGSYGSFSIDASGNWSYALNNGNAAVNALNVGQHLTDTFTITTDDGTTHQISVTINGANDAATFSGADTGAVTEDAVPNTATGHLIVSDVDNAGNVLTQTDTAGDHGSFSIDAAGNWSYALDNGDAAVNALNVGDSLTDTFTVTTDDGTTHQISVTINGANDAATFSGADTGAVTEDAAPNTATGQLIVSDVDNAGNVLTQTDTAGDHGSFSIDAAGNWTYALDNGDAAVNALNVGDSLTDTFTVTTDDGTTHQISVTINGANDAATFSGQDSGTVVEDGAGNPIGGHLIVSDVDNAGNVVVQTDQAGDNGYGSFSIDAAGNWTYALDNSNSDVNGLNAGDTLTDTLTVTTDDGTTHQISVTIDGANDAAVIGGNDTGSVTEDASPNTTGGTLTVSDADNPATFAAESNVATDHGSFSIDTSGNWTFTLDNGNAAVNALNNGDTLTDTITVASSDGTTHNVVVTINGANDAAVIGGNDTGSVTEDASPNTTGGMLTVSDVDNPATFTVENNVASTNGYGSFSIDASGNWTYALDNGNAAVNALNNGDHLTDTATVTSSDGTTHVVTITIDGHTDGPVFVDPTVYTGGNDPNDFDIRGAPTDDTINGNSDTDLIYGGAGNDHLNGNNGNDLIYGGSGNDTIDGNNQNDQLYGGSGSDNIDGSNDNDTLIGGYGADTLTGGNGADTFVYLDQRDTGDTITDFSHAEGDKINLSALGVTTFVGSLGSDPNAPALLGAHSVGFETSGGVTTLYVDTNGIAGADLEIHLSNGVTPVLGDFILHP